MAYLTIAGFAIIDIWAAIAPAILSNTDPLLSSLTIAGSVSVSIFITVYLVVYFRNWFIRRFRKDKYFGGRTERFMAKYGTVGLGLLTPVVLGPVLTCAAAIAIGAKPRQMVIWGVVGAFIWSFGVYVALALGYQTILVESAR